jgi:DNA ligase (NAD+)
MPSNFINSAIKFLNPESSEKYTSKLDYINKLTIKQLEELIDYTQKAYHSDQPVITDEIFDLLCDELTYKSPNNPILKVIGAPVRDSINKVKLPFWMGSMDKIKPASAELARWLSKNEGAPYIISEKLDGLSGLITYNLDNPGSVHLYTRGNGIEGQNIDHLTPYLPIPPASSIKDKLAVRGEFIITKDIFANKYAKDFPKARSLVAGLINSKHPDPTTLKDLLFITYEVIMPELIRPSKQFRMLEAYGFAIAKHKKYDALDSDALVKILSEFKSTSKFEIDGIIVTLNKEYTRNTSGNPKYSVAFKMSTADDIIETTVLEVEWNASKHGALKPRIKVAPVILGGDTVQYATGFNARFIVDNKVAPGAKVRIMKSGDVIPYIESVSVQAKEPAMPKDIKYHWNETEVDIILDDKDGNDEVVIRQLISFMTTLKIPYLSQGNITKFYNAGIKTIKQFYKLSINDIIALDIGFKESMATKIYGAIHGVLDEPISLMTLMAASNVFGSGLGERKLAPLITAIPNVMTRSSISLDEIKQIPGYSDKSASAFLFGLAKFKEFMNTNKFLKLAEVKAEPVIAFSEESKIKGISVVFTGFRSDELEQRIKLGGGTVASTVSSKTNVVVNKDAGDTSSKIMKAKSLNIPVISVEDFMKRYF